MTESTEGDQTMTDDQTRPDALTRLVLQSAVAKLIKGEVDATRAEVAPTMNPGDRKTVYHGETDLGAVTMTKPTKTAVIADGAQFLAHVVEDHPSEIVMEWQLKPGVTWQEVAATLAEFDEGLAADVVALVPTVAPAYRTRALKDAESGQPAPGVELVAKAPVMQVRPAADANRLALALLGGALPEIGGQA